MVIGIDASRAFGEERTGTENYSYHLITQMLQLPMAKFHSFVLFTRPNAIIPDELGGYSNVSLIEIKQKYLWTQVGLARETWVQKLDLLWIPAHTLPILRKPGLKTIVTIHGLEYRWLPEYNNLLQRWYLPLSTFYASKAATKLICVSESTKRDLLSEIQIDTEKIIVIYEGVADSRGLGELDVMESTLDKWNLKKGKYILFVGTIQPRKNLVALMRGFAKYYSSNSDYRLVIAGAVGWKAEEDLACPEKLGIPEAVVFTGRITDQELQALYLSASVYIQPSWTEGFGLPVLEAMKASVPVIVSDGGALPEIVGEAGIVVPLGKFEENVGRAIEQATGASRVKMIAAGRKRASELSWKIAAEKTLKSLLAIG